MGLSEPFREKQYEMAEYETIMKCPNCGWHKLISSDGMPDRYDWMRKTDEDGIDYIECFCGCKFIEE